MGFNSSLDDIINSKRRTTSRDRHTRRPSSINRPSPSSSFSQSPRNFSFTTEPMSYYLSRYERGHQDLRARISQSSTKQQQSRSRPDLRVGINKRRLATAKTAIGLSTSNLPNRQRMNRRHQHDNDFDNEQANKEGSHSIIITKPVYRNDTSLSSISSSSVSGLRRSGHVDPASIVITKAVKKHSPPPETTTSASIPDHHMETDQKVHQESTLTTTSSLSPPPSALVSGDAERLSTQRYIEDHWHEQQQTRQEMEQEMQQQIKAQNEQILELQRLLSNQQQRVSVDLTAHQQYTNNNNNNSHHHLPTSTPTSNTVLLSNLDPMTTSTDVEIVCGGFGIVVRCDVARDTQGRSGGEAEVEFLDHDSGLDCIAKLDNELVDGRIIRAILRHPPPMQQHTMRSVIAPTRTGFRTTSQVLYMDKRS